MLYKISEPILREMSEGTLQQNMEVEYSPHWGNGNKKVLYMEAFGRTMVGLAPWLSLPDDDTKEGLQRKQLKEWALKSYANAVDPTSADYLLWEQGAQPLVDAAFIAQSFIRAYDSLWLPLDEVTKQRYIERFQQLRRVNPPNSNWLLFSSTVETFLSLVGAESDSYRISAALRSIEEWYVGDGWYSDGPHFALDYYNSFVIQPMYLECLDILTKKGTVGVDKACGKEHHQVVLKRMQRNAQFLERFIAPDGTFPVFGRSMVYRLGAFQPLSMLAWRKELPQGLSNGQVRAALTAVMKNMFDGCDNFNSKGYLNLGFCGHQPEMVESYINNGSAYLTSIVFLPLGLAADDPFWTDEAQEWTSQKAWTGKEFPRDSSTK